MTAVLFWLIVLGFAALVWLGREREPRQGPPDIESLP